MLRGEPAPFFVWACQKGAEVSKIGTPPAAGCHKRRLPDDAIMTSLPSPSDLFLAAPVSRRSQRAAAKEANILISNLISFPDREDDESEHGNRADRDIANVAVMLQQPTITRHLRRMSKRVRRQKRKQSESGSAHSGEKRRKTHHAVTTELTRCCSSCRGNCPKTGKFGQM